MATVMDAPERTAQKVILNNISWQTYERLLAEHSEGAGTRFVYDGGALEIMIVSYRHEVINRIVASLVAVLAEEMNVDVIDAGSTTFKHADLARGFEPDSCFYIAHAELMRGKNEVDLTLDPPPDLVIEIDITHPSLPRLPLLAAVGIPEVWRYDGGRASIHRLDRDTGTYREAAQSAALAGVTHETLSRFVAAGLTTKRNEWLRRVRAWAREQAQESP
jgi:Uma2 family endonuclease